MKKFLLIALFFVLIFAAKSVSASPAHAGSFIMGKLVNNGSIPVNVWIQFMDKNGQFEPTRNFPVTAGATVWADSDYDPSGDAQPFSIRWGTDCTDPFVDASLSSRVDGMSGDRVYSFADQDVTCTTPNATPYISNTACANFGWTLNGVGYGGPNISSFEVYMSTNSSQVGPGDPTIGPYGTKPSSGRFYDFGALGSGTYYVRVRAVSPQGVGSWSSVNQFTCASAGLAPVAASGLNASRSCNGTGAITANIVNVAFTWTKSTPTPSDAQWIDYSVFNNNFANNFKNARVDSASSYNGTGFAQGITYYWRINNLYGTNWYPSATGSFVTPTCPPGGGGGGGSSPPPATPPPPLPGSSTITGVADCSLGGVMLKWTVTGLPIPQGFNLTTGITYTSPGLSGFTVQPAMQYYYPATGYWNQAVIPFGTNTAGTKITGPVGYATLNVDRTSSNNFGQSYTYYAFNYYSVENPPGSGHYDLGTTMSSGITITNPAACAPAVVYTITASGNSDCIDGTNAKVHLTWTTNTDNTGYTIYKDGVAQSPTVAGAGRSWDSGPEIAGQTHSWVVTGTGGVAGTRSSTAVSVTTAACEPPPADPTQLTIRLTCNGSNPEVLFTFTDRSTNEDGFWLDVNTKAWTGPTAPSPWGVKTITRTPAEKTAVLGRVSYLWSASTPLDSGTPLTPAKGTQYYWRVKAFNASRQSNHAYPASGAIAPGSPFTTLSCTPNYDMAIRDVNWPSKRTFDLGERVSFDIVVENRTTTGGNVPPTQLYLYPDSPSVPVCANNLDGSLNVSASSPATTIPKDSASPPVDQSYPVSPASSPIGPGGTQTITVSFKVANSESSHQMVLYVVPTCDFMPSLGQDPNFSNNESVHWTYFVAIKGFFETQGGDVGAAVGQSISVGFDSSTIPVASGGSKYQGDYVIAAGNVDSSSNVHSRKGWMLNNYDKRQVSSSGIYDFLANKFEPPADIGCNFSGTEPIRRCSGNLTFNTATAPTGNTVYFVERDLEIKQNLILGAADSIVFIVKGDITVDTSVNRIDGIYVSRHSFIDHDTADPALVAVADALTVNGAVYVDSLPDGLGNVGKIDFKRYFSGPYNSTNASVKIVYDPKYLISMRDIIGVKSIIWKEVAP